MKGSKDIVNFLIEHKINITAEDNQDKTAIEYANENKQEEIVSILIEMWPKQNELPLPPTTSRLHHQFEYLLEILKKKRITKMDVLIKLFIDFICFTLKIQILD